MPRSVFFSKTPWTWKICTFVSLLSLWLKTVSVPSKQYNINQPNWGRYLESIFEKNWQLVAINESMSRTFMHSQGNSGPVWKLLKQFGMFIFWSYVKHSICTIMSPKLIPRPECILEDTILKSIHSLYICAASMLILTWMSFHRHCKATRFPPNGLLQCDLWCPCSALLFHILCKV